MKKINNLKACALENRNPKKYLATIIPFLLMASPSVSFSATDLNTNSELTAVNDKLVITDKSAVEINVLANDTYGNLPTISVTKPLRGSASVQSDGTILYTPKKQFKKGDFFIYTISNGSTSSSALVSISLKSKGDSSTDAGDTTDTGTSTDTGDTTDTGTSTDTGDTTDTGTSTDTGDTTDTGTSTDTGDTTDTGTSTDTGDTTDTGTSTDTGDTTDTGTSTDTGDTTDPDTSTDTSDTLNPHVAPSQNFDLTKWKLTLPVSQDEYFGTGGSSAAEILPQTPPASEINPVSALDDSYEDPNYFYTATDGAMLFSTPLYGGTSTVNSSYVRTELRELYNWNPSQSSSSANWDNEGSHILKAELEVVSYWADDPQTVVGQIHAKDSSKALVKLQWDGPNKPVRAIINEDPSDGNPFSLSFDTVGQSKFTYAISLVDNKLSITVNDKTQTVTFGEGNMSSDWDNHVYYFKAGNYPQADKSGGGVFDVSFTKLEVNHSN